MENFISFFLKFKSNLLVKRVFFLLNAAFAMAILDLISRVHLPSFVNMLPKYLKHSTFSKQYIRSTEYNTPNLLTEKMFRKYTHHFESITQSNQSLFMLYRV